MTDKTAKATAALLKAVDLIDDWRKTFAVIHMLTPEQLDVFVSVTFTTADPAHAGSEALHEYLKKLQG